MYCKELCCCSHSIMTFFSGDLPWLLPDSHLLATLLAPFFSCINPATLRAFSPSARRHRQLHFPSVLQDMRGLWLVIWGRWGTARGILSQVKCIYFYALMGIEITIKFLSQHAFFILSRSVWTVSTFLHHCLYEVVFFLKKQNPAIVKGGGLLCTKNTNSAQLLKEKITKMRIYN